MIDILAQAATSSTVETTVAVVAATILALGGREGIAAVQRKRQNGNAFNKPLCDERHKQLDSAITRLFNKLDKIHEDVNRH